MYMTQRFIPVATSNLSGGKVKAQGNQGHKKADNGEGIKLPLDRKTLVIEAQNK